MWKLFFKWGLWDSDVMYKYISLIIKNKPDRLKDRKCEPEKEIEEKPTGTITWSKINMTLSNTINQMKDGTQSCK